MQTTTLPSYAEGLKELRKQLDDMLPADALIVFDRDAEALQKTHQGILKLKKGDMAPDFTLSNATNKEAVPAYMTIKVTSSTRPRSPNIATARS